MIHPEQHPWVDWSKRLAAIAQNGLTFSHDRYDLERYNAIRDIAAEMLATGSGLEFKAVRGILDRDTGYATPKVDVRGVVFRDDKLLLVKERSDGKWTLPGGWADISESPSESVVREVREESGFVTRATKLLALFDRSKHPHQPPFPFHVYKVCLLCSIIGGSASPSSETTEVAFFDEQNLPELSIDRVTEGQLRRLFEHHRNPSLLPDFD